jgi:hypothetical protein
LVAKELPDVTVHGESALDEPWTTYTAIGAAADAGPAGIHATAAARPPVAARAKARRKRGDERMRNLRESMDGMLGAETESHEGQAPQLV